MADESLEEIMARALWLDRFPDDPWEKAPSMDAEDYRGHARAALAAAEAHGYEITKRDPEMMRIQEIDPRRPITR